MNPHVTCQTCTFNVAAVCTNPAAYCHGASLQPWHTCSQHTPPLPTPAELQDRLAVCAAALEHLAAKVPDCRDLYADRAAQCRSWAADLKEGHRVGDQDIIGGLREFEALAL